MSFIIAIVAPGEMGSAMGATLVAHGARVMTSSVGRSAASLSRATAAGFTIVASDEELVEADFVLSVVPPGAALQVAERLCRPLAGATRKPIYVDCNAVAPQTVTQVEKVIAPTGCAFVDAGLFGGPTSGKPGVVIYASGPQAPELLKLASLGVVVRVVDGPIGAASAVKLSFAGLNKGFTAIGTFMLLAALRSQSGDALIELLAQSQPGILSYVSRFVPAMFPKAYRWEPEMEEIAAFLGDDQEARDVFLAFAKLYKRIGIEAAAPHSDELESLRAFCRDAAQFK